MLILIGLIVLTWLLIQTTPVQNWLVRQVTHKLSKELHTEVQIDHVDFSLFNKMLLEGTLAKDQQGDTLLYAGTLKVRITDWFFLQDHVDLHYIGLDDATIHLQRSDSLWNYHFLVDYFSSPGSSKKSSVELSLESIELNHIKLLQQDGWRGENLALSIGSMNVQADSVSFQQRRIRINEIDLSQPAFSVYNYDGNRPDSLRPPDTHEKIINDPLHLRWNAGGWDILVKQLNLKDGDFKNDRQTDREPYPYFDGLHIHFADINATFKSLRLQADTITTQLTLSTREQSGFVVNKLQATVKMHPEAMEFHQLDLVTPHSRLHDFFAMRYDTFDDMSDFEHSVRMEGHFNNAALSSDDIAYFAPALTSWKKDIHLNGTVTGAVDNLRANNLVIQAGKNSSLNGDIVIKGLPDVDQTFIDFEANNFRTNYADAMLFFPELKSVAQPNLKELRYLNFKGNFTGFIKDFVTYGTIETALGTLVTDLNMKLASGTPRYSGNLKTTLFDLGTFINTTQVGKFSFKGKINGTGLRAKTLNAQLDGTIDQFEFNGYAYQDVMVKGTVAKELFNGELTSRDPNFDAHLNGLVDLSQEIPRFDFEANVNQANLKNLHLLKNDVAFNGKFHFNFSGDNIDNFLGDARVYDAAVFKNGKRISFDSLYVESKVMGDNKVVTAVSNEFDGALVGDFSIRDLPSAFQTFLNKYYPSYIKPSRSTLQNENFSFVITTKNISEYMDIFSDDLGGFNYSTITGRINSKENLLDLNAEIPAFNYKNIAVYNLAFKGRGNLDSLVAESSIADIYLNDSLHFPGTVLNIRSGNNQSHVSLQTSANQTLNTAHLTANIETLPKGIRVVFDESTFDINGKTWTISEKGEFVITEDLLYADGIKLYNGQQEIRVLTVPSDIGNTNDVKIDLTKINIGDFTPYLVKQNRIEGLLTGTVNITDPYGQLQVDVFANADQFRLDNDSIGRLRITSNYNQRTGQVLFNTRSDNKLYNFDLAGTYSLADSIKKENLNIDVDIHDTRISLLDKYLSNIFTDLDGQAAGKLTITGPPDALKYLGDVKLTNGALKVIYTNVPYKIPAATFHFEDDHIDFGSFAIQDTLGNVGQISRGKLYHHSFNDLSFDFAMNTNRLLVLSTDDKGTEPYYGNVIAKANMTFNGPLENMRMEIRGEPADSSRIYIKPSTGRESAQTDFTVWKVYGREMEALSSEGESNLTVKLSVTANNYLKTFVILDPLTGDIIESTGHGNLDMIASTEGEFSITGRYDIDQGKYNFNFESLLRKPFILRPEAGNYIQWQGDPYQADIKIEAEYLAENVRFSDLQSPELEATSTDISSNNVRKFRGEVIVVAQLTDNLMAPTIHFRLELPPTSQLKNDMYAQNILSRIESDENELNKQVAFLIVFNSFGPVSTSTQSSLANQAFEGLVVNSISGVISNTLSSQFSNIFQRIFKDPSIHVDFNAQLYNGTNFIDNTNRNGINIDRTNLNLSIGKSFLDERLTFTFGSALDFGLTSAQVEATRNLQFLPDISAEWKIRQDGKLVLTFFYRDSYNYLTGVGTRQNRSGTSISYRREFDKLSELWQGNNRRRRQLRDTTVIPDKQVTDSMEVAGGTRD